MDETTEEYRLKRELVGLFGHLSKLRRELAALQGSGEPSFSSMAETLDDIVQNTEAAGNSILESMEAIDALVGGLRSHSDPAVVKVCGQVNDQVNNVFEACSFQDLTGQRISRLGKGLAFIEDRVNTMIKMWGRDEIAKVIEEVKQDNAAPKDADAALLHGPQSATAAISQADIDKLFG